MCKFGGRGIWLALPGESNAWWCWEVAASRPPMHLVANAAHELKDRVIVHAAYVQLVLDRGPQLGINDRQFVLREGNRFFGGVAGETTLKDTHEWACQCDGTSRASQNNYLRPQASGAQLTDNSFEITFFLRNFFIPDESLPSTRAVADCTASAVSSNLWNALSLILRRRTAHAFNHPQRFRILAHGLWVRTGT